MSQNYRPWHAPLVEKMSVAIAQGAMHHALLLQGPVGTGKRLFAQEFARYLLCAANGLYRSNDNFDGLEACGSCAACLLNKAATHPDYHRLEPKEPGKQIAIDAVRAMQEQLLKTAQMGGAKVCVIEPADLLNESSASALLKLLEEPPANTYFLLVADRPQYLLPTVKSRCLALAFSLPDREFLKTELLSINPDQELVEQALRRSRGFPEQALKLVRDADYSQVESQKEQLFERVVRAWGAGNIASEKELGALLEYPIEEVLDRLLYQLHSFDRQLAGGHSQEASHDASHNMFTRTYELRQALLQAKQSLARNPNAKLLLKTLNFEFQSKARYLAGIS